jgi:lipopolysaccharide export system protein LptA
MKPPRFHWIPEHHGMALLLWLLLWGVLPLGAQEKTRLPGETRHDTTLIRPGTTPRSTVPAPPSSPGVLSVPGQSLQDPDKKRIDIEQADFLEFNEAIVANAQRLIGNVRIRHNEVLMWCDSAYAYNGTNRVDAFGNVHINQGDTAHLYADMIYYDGDRSFARAIKNVRLVNKSTTLFSDTVDYDLVPNMGYYDDNGKIIDSTNVLTSQIARYFVDEDIVYFYQNVVGYNDKYRLESDTVKYNTATGIFYIQGPTTIRDSVNTIYAEDGWYDSRTGEAQLLKNPLVYNEKQQMKGDVIDYDRNKGYGKARGMIEIIDIDNNVIVKGRNAWFDEITETAFITDSALFIMVSEGDSLFLHADTLKTVADTIPDEKIIKAFNGVRFYRTDLQGKCDSLVYFSRDSTIQLHREPVLWSEIHQMSADYIEMMTYNPAPDEVHLRNNAFIISRQDSVMFDQVKGKNMTGFIVNEQLDHIFVDGNGQTIYYARDKGNIIGLNRAESSKLAIQFREGKAHRISFLGNPEGKLTPIPQLSDEERHLAGFDWKEKIRPLSREDIFRKTPPSSVAPSSQPEEPETAPSSQPEEPALVPAGEEK